MPLFMDIHNVDSDSFSVEDVVKAHMEDLAVEKKFGVSQIKYWVNVDDKTIFCLMQGPDKEACHAVHAESHGLTACNIIEVSDDEFNLYLGIGNKSEQDLAQTLSGDVDAGFRTLLLISNLEFTGNCNHILKKEIKLVEAYEGSLIIQPNENIMASFTQASRAIECAQSIGAFLKTSSNKFEYRIGIATGNPVDETGTEIFEETRKTIKRLCLLGTHGCIYLDSSTKLMHSKEVNAQEFKTDDIRIVNTDDFHFINSLFQQINENLSNSEFTSSKLNAALGLSKSQAYRRIKALTDITPNNLIREVKLRQSLSALKKTNTTVAEVAYEHGFNSPTYFTRAFHKRFGMSPSLYSKLF